MPLPVLYSFRRCPYAIRARLALAHAGITVELREVDLKRKPAELLACSPAGTVPVLDLGRGKALSQSLDIMRWALQQHDPGHWLATAEAPDNLALLQANDTPFKAALDRYKYAERHPEAPQHQHREQAEATLLAPLERRLRQAPFLGGAQPGFTDAAVFPFVRQFAGVEPAWWSGQPWPATHRWLTHWQAGALLARCMDKVAVWQAGAAPVYFPARTV